MQLRKIGQKIRDIRRFNQILRILTKHGFGFAIQQLHLEEHVIGRGIIKTRVLRRFTEPLESRAVRLRKVLEELGPTFIKFGQALSVRPDLVPLDLCNELSKLQDRVPPFGYEAARKQIKDSFGSYPEELFSAFDQTPFASASLGQAHRAQLKTGEEVVVKVQRPDIRKIIETDMDILYTLAQLASRYMEELKVYDPISIVNEFSKTIMKEIDFTHEAHNIDRFRKNFKDSTSIHIPKVFWDYTKPKVITTEEIKGIRMNDYLSQPHPEEEKKAVAANGANAVLQQIFIDGFFHADPHPGNIFILPNNAAAFIDFGIVGRLDEETENEVGKAVSALKKIENVLHSEFLNRAKSQAEENSWNPKNLLLDERVKTAEQIHETLEGYGETFEVPSLPYTESHGRNTVFTRSTISPENEIEPVVKKTLETFDFQSIHQVNILDELMGTPIQSEGSQVFSSWEAKEAQQTKILDEYKLIGKGSHFKSFKFPEEDYTEYVRRQTVLSSTVRRILEKLRLFRNVGGEDYRYEYGSLDLQEAIQVIASKSPRTDVFVRDELQTQNEMWTILIDASHSLSFFTGEVLDIALCMAEIARKLMVNQNSWSMFAFNNGFYIIKDFDEPYSNHTRARIGGLKHKGMTYLPDGLLLAGEALRRRGGDMKVLVAVSDFFPSGYGEMEKALAESAKKVEKTGIGIIGIGINSNAVKKYLRTNCVVENPYDLMKKFTKAFFEFSSTV